MSLRISSLLLVYFLGFGLIFGRASTELPTETDGCELIYENGDHSRPKLQCPDGKEYGFEDPIPLVNPETNSISVYCSYGKMDISHTKTRRKFLRESKIDLRNRLLLEDVYLLKNNKPTICFTESEEGTRRKLAKLNKKLHDVQQGQPPLKTAACCDILPEKPKPTPVPIHVVEKEKNPERKKVLEGTIYRNVKTSVFRRSNRTLPYVLDLTVMISSNTVWKRAQIFEELATSSEIFKKCDTEVVAHIVDFDLPKKCSGFTGYYVWPGEKNPNLKDDCDFMKLFNENTIKRPVIFYVDQNLSVAKHELTDITSPDWTFGIYTGHGYKKWIEEKKSKEYFPDTPSMVMSMVTREPRVSSLITYPVHNVMCSAGNCPGKNFDDVKANVDVTPKQCEQMRQNGFAVKRK